MFWKANDVSCRSRPFPTLAVKNFLTNSWPQVEAERCSPRAWTTDARALLIGDVEFPSSQSRLRVEDGDAPGGCKASGSKSIDRLLPRCRRNPACRSTPRPGSLIFLGRHLPNDAALRFFDRYPWLVRMARIASVTLSTQVPPCAQNEDDGKAGDSTNVGRAASRRWEGSSFEPIAGRCRDAEACGRRECAGTSVCTRPTDESS